MELRTVPFTDLVAMLEAGTLDEIIEKMGNDASTEAMRNVRAEIARRLENVATGRAF